MSVEHMRDLLSRANRALVGGSLGMFQLPDDLALVFSHGAGSRVFDVAGRAYIDCVLGSGPLILGHAHPAVVAAIQKQVALGSTFYTLNEPAILLAEKLIEAIPCAETVRFVATGSEADHYAVRIARAFTGRDKVLKFEGGWHGGNDVGQMSASPAQPGGYPTPQPDSDGIPERITADYLVAPFNDLEIAAGLIERHRSDLAAVIVEPLQRTIRPRPGFLEGLREVTQRHGIVLIFDEIVTGFRLAWGGAQERYGVVPDLATFGKTISGGTPLAAVCGPREIMEVTNPRQKGKGPYTFVSGTFNGNPVGASAGLATLAELRKPGVYARLHAIGDRFKEEVEGIARRRGLPVRVEGDGPVRQVMFTDREVLSWKDVVASDNQRARQLGYELLKRGLFVTPGGKTYLSAVHSDEDMGLICEAHEEAFKAV
ncbi:MAG: aspartate aminotransferase family protein [Candidatus Latescibacteria bacterium]|nr:aspartate aminotransferase family protein [Candidatus Latescibacterota bacterium]